MRKNDWVEGFFDQYYLRAKAIGISHDLTRQECDYLVKFLGLQPGQSVLDLGCGNGRHAIELSNRGYGPIIGLDYSTEAISLAKTAVSNRPNAPEFVHADMRELNYSSAFDAIFSAFNSMFYWDDAMHSQILSRVYRALKPGGLVLIDVYNREAKVGDKLLDDHWLVGRLRRASLLLGAVKHRIKNIVRGNGIAGAYTPDETVFDIERGVMVGTKFLPTSHNRSEPKTFEIRLYAATELLALVKGAGFEVDQIFSLPDGGPIRIATERWGILLRRPQLQ